MDTSNIRTLLKSICDSNSFNNINNFDIILKKTILLKALIYDDITIDIFREIVNNIEEEKIIKYEDMKNVYNINPQKLEILVLNKKMHIYYSLYDDIVYGLHFSLAEKILDIYVTRFEKVLIMLMYCMLYPAYYINFILDYQISFFINIETLIPFIAMSFVESNYILFCAIPLAIRINILNALDEKNFGCILRYIFYSIFCLGLFYNNFIIILCDFAWMTVFNIICILR